MKQATINELIESIPPVCAWALAARLSDNTPDEDTFCDYYEDSDPLVLEYLKNRITEKELFHPVFESHFVKQLGHFRLYDRIQSILEDITIELMMDSGHKIDMFDSSSVADDYLNHACNELFKMLTLTDEWKDLHDFFVKFPKVLNGIE